MDLMQVLEAKKCEIYAQKIVIGCQEGWYRDLSATDLIGVVATAQVLICLGASGFDRHRLYPSADTLEAFSRSDGGFPFISNLNSIGVVDATAWACLALISCPTTKGQEGVVEKSLAWLLDTQNTDGGWGIIKSSPSRVVSTTVVVRAMLAIKNPGQEILIAIGRGVKFVTSEQLPCGAWQDVSGKECLGATAYALIMLSESDQRKSGITRRAIDFIISRLDRQNFWDKCLNREDVQLVESGQHKRLNFIYPLTHLFIRGILACGSIDKIPSCVIEKYLEEVALDKSFAGEKTDSGKATSYGQHDLVMSLIEVSKHPLLIPKIHEYPGYETISHTDYPRIYQVAGSEVSSVDVIFFHGLEGDAKDTWINKEYNFYLPREVGENTNTRCFVIGYSNPASRFLGKGMSLEERSKNLLALLRSNFLLERSTVLVGHSFGGLLIKKIMLEIKLAGDAVHFDNLKGVVFLATPHSGSRWANLIYLAQGVFGGTLAVRDLRYKNRELIALNKDFDRLVSGEAFKVKLQSYGENANFMVVNARSSNPKVASCEHLAIDANHSEICKPKDSRELVFLSMCEFIKRFVRGGL